MCDFRFVADKSDMPDRSRASPALLRRSSTEDEVKKGCDTRFPKPMHALNQMTNKNPSSHGDDRPMNPQMDAHQV
jgi:hypothetical protein